MTAHTITQTIPLNLLSQSKANVRSTGAKDGIAELAASIAAHGLRQNLNVLPVEGGRFEVVAGGRRLRALKLLAKDGRLAKDAPIPCLILAEGDDAAEISLVENTLRTAMHPDDQCTAFRALIEDKGMGLEEVAARFGITPAVVRRRLKLAHVSPRLRGLFRKGDITLEQMMAFAISDDHAAQEAVWKALPEWNREPDAIRDALTGDALPLTDKLARFIGEECYVAAGGAVLRDLFDSEGAGYLTDRALVLKLVEAKLAEAADSVRAEGWKWAVAEIMPDYSTQYRRLYPVQDEEDDGAPLTYAAEDMARAGARLTIERDGTLHIEHGLIHPDDWKGEMSGNASRAKPKADPAALPATLVEGLTAHRTAALRQALAGNPSLALAATVHGLAVAHLYPGCALLSCLALRMDSIRLEQRAHSLADCAAHAAMAQMAEEWGQRLPANAADLWDWCLAQPQDVLLALLAYLAALSIHAVQSKADRPDSDRLAHAQQLVQAVGLDMRAQWTPSVEGFYSRLSKASLIHAVQEAGVQTGVVISALKKAEAARYVAGLLAGSTWLPAPLRAPLLEAPVVVMADAA